jgi:hypothetical protein
MEMGLLVTVVMVAMMVLMVGGMIWGVVTTLGARKRPTRKTTQVGWRRLGHEPHGTDDISGEESGHRRHAA